jgi:hypothetical protein
LQPKLKCKSSNLASSIPIVSGIISAMRACALVALYILTLLSSSKGYTNEHSCAVLSGGTVKCWGLNGAGQLGDGTTNNRLTPVGVTGLDSGVALVSSGPSHNCAVEIGGSAKCWGYNGYCQLGDGTSNNRRTPVSVVGLASGVASIAAGQSHSCAVLSSGAAKCWGGNGNGELGDGTTNVRSTPVGVVGLASGVASIAAGGSHSCAVLSSGALKCWGSNQQGQLGDGTQSTSITPVGVVGLASGVVSIADGIYHSCAVLSERTAKCWGGGPDFYVATDICRQGVQSLAVGWAHTCVSLSIGTAYCWGRENIKGQLGDNTTQGTDSSTVGFCYSNRRVPAFSNVSVKFWDDVCISVLLKSFKISSKDRTAGKSNASATISFFSHHPILSSSRITLTYPANFFLASVIPYMAVGSSSIANLTLVCSPTAVVSLVCTVSGAAISSSSYVNISIGGLTMGNKTAGSDNVGVSVGCTTSNMISSGAIFSKVLDASLVIPLIHRVAGKASVTATLSFTSIGTMIPTGSNITLNYPPNFFAPSTPFVNAGASSVTNLVILCSPTSSTSIILTTSMAAISTSPFVVTISGFTIGSSGANVTGGISVTTSVHPDPSDGVDSGILLCPPGSYWTGQPPTCTQGYACLLFSC